MQWWKVSHHLSLFVLSLHVGCRGGGGALSPHFMDGQKGWGGGWLCRAELMERGVESGATVHIVNMNVKDNHVQAKKGAELCLRFCEMVGSLFSFHFPLLYCLCVNLVYQWTTDSCRCCPGVCFLVCAGFVWNGHISQVSDCDDLDEDIEKIIDEFEKQNSVHIMHTVSYY